MTPGEPMTYLETAKAVLSHKPATKAIKATKGSLRAVWQAGGWLVISDNGIRAVRVPPELRAWVTRHEAEVLRALHRHQVATRGTRTGRGTVSGGGMRKRHGG